MIHTFQNRDFCIKVSTNSRKILSIISNYLDLNGEKPQSKAFKISLKIEETPLASEEELKYFSSGWRKDKGFVRASLQLIKANASVNISKSAITATIFDYQEESKSSLLHFVLFRPLKLILAYRGLFALHASMVTNEKDRILILGPRNTGKSTFALSFIKRGFRLLCDDDCFVSLRKGQLDFVPFPTKMGLQDHTFSRHPELHKHNIKGYRSGGKLRLSLQHLYPRIKDPAGKTVLLFPRYVDRGSLKLIPLSSKKALEKLTRENLDHRLKQLDPEIFSNNFHALYVLSQKASCFEVVYNDTNLDGIFELIKKRVYESIAEK